MEVSLKKARKLENKIGSFISQAQDVLLTHTEIRINEDVTNIDTLVNEARKEFFGNFDNINNLVEARQQIRNLIAMANVNLGINDLIANKVLLESKLNKINNLLGFGIYNKQNTEDELDIHRKSQESGGRGYGRVRVTTGISFLTSIDEDKFKKDKQQLIKDIENCMDKLAELNYSSKVTINSNTVKLLQGNYLL